MLTINDSRWLTRFLSEHCRRGVHGPSNRAAIARFHIEIHHVGLPLEIRICDSKGALVVISYNGEDAMPLRYMAVDAALGKTDSYALTRSIRRLLRQHELIDCDGNIEYRNIA